MHDPSGPYACTMQNASPSIVPPYLQLAVPVAPRRLAARSMVHLNNNISCITVSQHVYQSEQYLHSHSDRQLAKEPGCACMFQPARSTPTTHAFLFYTTIGDSKQAIGVQQLATCLACVNLKDRAQQDAHARRPNQTRGEAEAVRCVALRCVALRIRTPVAEWLSIMAQQLLPSLVASKCRMMTLA